MRERTPPGRNRRGGPRPPARRAATPRKRAATRQTRRHIRAAGPNVTVRKRGKIIYLHSRERRNIPWRLIFALFLVFVGGVGSAVAYANNHEIRREIGISRSALNRQLDTNRSMRADTTERYSHDEIARRARALGLGEPDPSQVIYFYAAPLHSGVVFTYNPSAQQDNYFWQGIAGFFRGISNRVFGER